MADAWVWDMYRPARFVKNVKVVTFKDVNVEELWWGWKLLDVHVLESKEIDVLDVARGRVHVRDPGVGHRGPRRRPLRRRRRRDLQVDAVGE